MRFRKIALALFACMALGAFAANAAQAAGWETGTTENQTGGGTVLSGLTSLNVTCAKHSGSSLVLTSTLLSAPLKLEAKQIDCVEAKINNKYKHKNAEGKEEEITAPGHSEGKLRFTEVSVIEPANCEVGTTVGGVPHTLTTEALTDQIIMDPTSGSTTVFDKFSPEVAPNFITIKFEGASCALAGAEAPVTGTACGESVRTEPAGTFKPNVTGTLFKVQSLQFGSTQQTTGGCELKLGKAVAQLSGAVDNEAEGKIFGSA